MCVLLEHLYYTLATCTLSQQKISGGGPPISSTQQLATTNYIPLTNHIATKGGKPVTITELSLFRPALRDGPSKRKCSSIQQVQSSKQHFEKQIFIIHSCKIKILVNKPSEVNNCAHGCSTFKQIYAEQSLLTLRAQQQERFEPRYSRPEVQHHGKLLKSLVHQNFCLHGGTSVGSWWVSQLGGKGIKQDYVHTRHC